MMSTQYPSANIVNSQIDPSVKLYNNVRILDSYIGENCSIGDYALISNSKLDNYVEINKFSTISHSTIGFGSYINKNGYIKFAKIGKFCCVSWNATIYNGIVHDKLACSTYDHYHWAKIFSPEEIGGDNIQYLCQETTLGNDVWVGNGAIAINGIHIGDGAIIGAGAVVTKDVEPYSIIGGVPAKIIRKRFNEKTIEVLLRIRWWDWPLEVLKKYGTLIRGEKLTPDILSRLLSIYEEEIK